MSQSISKIQSTPLWSTVCPVRKFHENPSTTFWVTRLTNKQTNSGENSTSPTVNKQARAVYTQILLKIPYISIIPTCSGCWELRQAEPNFSYIAGKWKRANCWVYFSPTGYQIRTPAGYYYYYRWFINSICRSLRKINYSALFYGFHGFIANSIFMIRLISISL